MEVAKWGLPDIRIGMGRHLNCGGDFGAERRCFGELSKKQDDDMDNLKVGGQSPQKAHFAGGLCVMPLPPCLRGEVTELHQFTC